MTVPRQTDGPYGGAVAPGPAKRVPPLASEATRLLCAGTCLDETYRRTVIDELYTAGRDSRQHRGTGQAARRHRGRDPDDRASEGRLTRLRTAMQDATTALGLVASGAAAGQVVAALLGG